MCYSTIALLLSLYSQIRRQKDENPMQDHFNLLDVENHLRLDIGVAKVTNEDYLMY